MAHAIPYDESDPNFQIEKTFDDAWLQDLELIRQLSEQEQQEEEDRIMAARLAGVQVEPIPDNMRSLAMLLYDSDHENEHENEPIEINDTPIVSTIRAPYRQGKRKKCAVCMEYVIKTDPRLPCNHIYCIGCLQQLFEQSMQDETLMPPRCCQKLIPLDLARLNREETENFNAKQLEYSTKDRLYCSQPTCSAFIPPTLIVNSIGTCPKPRCRATTCNICKAASHGILDCPKDEDTAAVLAAAREAGWARCHQCRSMIELTHGCYHMTCRCRAQFCYLCSVPWKNCACPQWSEERLLSEARTRAERIPDTHTRHGDRVDINARVERMINQLRANYECEHSTGWTYRQGGGRCEECSDYLPQYLFRCNRCHFMACNRCRRNRL